MFKTCLENRVTHRPNNYKCYLCHYETPENDYTLILKHIGLKEHKEKFDEVDSEARFNASEVLLTISESQRRKLVDNGITFDKDVNYLRCHFCKSSFCGLSNTFEHIKSSTHIQTMNTVVDKRDNKKLPKTQKVAGNNVNKQHESNESIKNIDDKTEIFEKSINTRKSTVDSAEAFEYIEALEEPWFLCGLCKCNIDGLQNVKGHVQDRVHLRLLKSAKTDNVKLFGDNKKLPEIQKVAGNNDNKKSTFNESIKNAHEVKKEISEKSINTRKSTVDSAEAFKYIGALEESWFICRLCKCNIDGLQNLKEHVQEPAHLCLLKCVKTDNVKPVGDNKKLPEIQKVAGNDNKKFTFNENIKNAHEVKKEISEKSINTRKPTFDTAEAFSYIVSLENSWFRCTICNCKINGLKNIMEHVKGRSHLTLLEVQKTKNLKPVAINKIGNIRSNIKSCIVEIQYCTGCQIYLKSPKVVQFHNKLHLFKEFPIPWDIDIIKFKISKGGKAIIKCLLCNSFIANEEELEKHLNIPDHTARVDLFDKIGDIIMLEEKEVIAIEQEKLKKFEKEQSKYSQNALLCTLCNANIPKNNCDEHLKGKRHLTNMQSSNITNTNNISYSDKNATVMYDCFLCKKNYDDFIKLFCHYSSYEHQYKLKCFKMVVKNPYVTLIFHEDRRTIQCSLCDTKHFDCKSTIQHLTGRNHNKHLEQSNITSSATSITNLVELKSKQIDIKTDKNVTELQSKQNNKKTHNNITALQSKQNNEKTSNIKSNQNINPTPKPKMKKKKTEFETSPEELLKLGFSLDNLNLMDTEADLFDDVLNDLVRFDLNRTQEKKLPTSFKGKKPRTPNTEQRKVNAFCKNVKLYGKNYIKLCINSGKENIYNVDPEDIRLMKLGCELIFPWESEKVCPPCSEPLPNDKMAIYEHLQDEEHLKTLRDMEANDKEFEDYPDQYSDLKLAHLYLVEESENVIQCYACNLKIRNDNLDIQRHSLLADHLSNSQHWKKLSDEMFQEFSNIFTDIWYYAQVFICEICQSKYDFEIDFVMHLESDKHKNKVASLKCNRSKFCICPVCITYWYGQSNSFKIHCKDSYHKRFASNGDLMIPNMTTNALNFLSSLSLKVMSMIEESNKAVFEKYKELALTEAIEETVQCKYPKAKAYIFGSRLSRLAFSNSDVDVFLDCEGVYYDSTTQEQCQKYLSSIRCYFENNPNVWIVEEIIMVTRVPIIKLRHIPTQLKCDISFINGLSVEKSTLIGNYNEAYVICRELILYLKKWLNICQIAGSDCITTFALSWFVIFYLQVQGVFPSVHELIKKNNQSKVVDGWECGFLETIPVKSSVLDLDFTDHLYNFFSYYAKFDYKTEVICPYLGKVLKKSTFAYADNLPKEMKIYKDRLKAEKGDIFRFDSPMCIQDPIDLSQNMTKAVKKRQLRCFRQYCFQSANKVSKEIET